jgi:pimeloyl-ACP methyl ester carboxylesterase
MADPITLADHTGVRLTHGKPKVNGVEIHYAIGGTGEPVFLLHGVPKTMSYWRHVVPLLTPHYSVIAVDNRGFGGSQRPLTGYDTATMAGDVAELAGHLGFDRFRVAGEDWGAAIAYAVAAFHRPRVRRRGHHQRRHRQPRRQGPGLRGCLHPRQGRDAPAAARRPPGVLPGREPSECLHRRALSRIPWTWTYSKGPARSPAA